MKRMVILWLMFAILPFCYAQEDAKRIEIETKFRSENYQVVPMGSHGLMLFTEKKDKVLGGKDTWYFTHYDTDLNKTWESQVQINNWMDFQSFDVDGSQIYLVFTRFASQDFDFIKVDVKTQTAQRLRIPAMSRLTFKDMKVMNSYAFIAGMAKNTPILLHFNLNENADKDDILKILPTSTTKKSEFEFLDKDTANQLLNFNFVNWKGGRSSLVMRSYDPSGEALSEIYIPRTEDKNLLTGKQSITEEGNVVIIGTYANGVSKLSDGIYIAEFDGPKPRYIRYYNFADLQNFFNYLSEKQKLKIEKKKERKESKHKDLNLKYNLLVHNLISKDDQYTLVAEAYYPTYRYDNGANWNGGIGFYNRYRYGYPMGNQKIFDGFQYTHAVLANFTKDGKLQWDNSFALEKVKRFDLKEMVKLNFEKDQTKLLYHFNGKLLAKVISENEVIADKNEIPLSTEHDHDKVKRSLKSELSYWYGNYFLAWGYQRIKNREDEVKQSRNVFFFNKIPF